jgi:hypothetical protein
MTRLLFSIDFLQVLVENFHILSDFTRLLCNFNFRFFWILISIFLLNLFFNFVKFLNCLQGHLFIRIAGNLHNKSDVLKRDLHLRLTNVYLRESIYAPIHLCLQLTFRLDFKLLFSLHKTGIFPLSTWFNQWRLLMAKLRRLVDFWAWIQVNVHKQDLRLILAYLSLYLHLNV